VKQLADDWDSQDKTLVKTIGDKEDLDLVYLWVLADRFCMPRLQNLVMETIELVNNESEKQKVPVRTFNAIYENTTVGSKLRKYAFGIATAYLVGSRFTKHPEDYPHAMLIDIANYYVSKSELCDEVDWKDFQVPVDEG
jgi:hypothetical protein